MNSGGDERRVMDGVVMDGRYPYLNYLFLLVLSLKFLATKRNDFIYH